MLLEWKPGLTPSSTHPPLIRTKLSASQLRASLVTRSRVLSLLSEGSERALTLICAPAGYGKTTLLTEWTAGLDKSKDGKRPVLNRDCT